MKLSKKNRKDFTKPERIIDKKKQNRIHSKKKAQQEKLYLIYFDDCIQDDQKTIFHIVGSKGLVYKVSFEDPKYTTFCWKCDCPQFMYRRTKCKHIFFIELTVLQMGEHNNTLIWNKMMSMLYELKNMTIIKDWIIDEDKRDKYKVIIENEKHLINLHGGINPLQQQEWWENPKKQYYNINELDHK